MPICNCPVGTVIPTITPSSCPYDIGQIQKVIFQRQGQTAGVGVTTGATESVWVALKAASDATKVQVSPYIYDAQIAEGDAIVEGGGDNSTLNGIGLITDANPSTFTGNLRAQQQSVVAAIRSYMCESVQVYLVNGDGQIIHDLDGSDKMKGFPIDALFVADPSLLGFGTTDHNKISFQLRKEWADGLTITDPESGWSFLSL
jgi:hypothetical protein